MVNDLLVVPKRNGAGTEQPPLKEIHEGNGGLESERFPNFRSSVQPAKSSNSQEIAQLVIVLGW